MSLIIVDRIAYIFYYKSGAGTRRSDSGVCIGSYRFCYRLGCPAGEYQYRNYPLRTDTSDYPDCRRGDSFWYTVYVG